MIAHPEALAIVAVVAALLYILYRVFGGGFSRPLRIDEDLHGPNIHGWDHSDGDGSASGCDGDGDGD